MGQSSIFSDPFTPSPGLRPFETGATSAPRSTVFSDPAEAERLDANLRRAQQPDTAARVLSMARKTGLPNEVIGRNLDALEQQTKAADFNGETFRKTSPLLASWMAENPEHAALGQQDVVLGNIEALVSAAGKLWGNLKVGLYGAAEGALGAVEATREQQQRDMRFRSDLPQKDRARYSLQFQKEQVAPVQRLRARLQQRAADAAAAVNDPGAHFLDRAISSGVQSIGQMVPGLAASILTKSPAPALTAMGVQTFGQSYLKARENGLKIEEAMRYGDRDAIVEVGTELLPASWLIKDLTHNAPLRKVFLHQLASEVPGEEVATVLQNLNAWATLPENEKKTFADYLHEQPSAMAETAVATLVTIVGASGFGRVMQRGVTGKEPAQQVLEDLGTAVQSSTTFQKVPGAVEDFVAKAAKGGGAETVYLPIDTFTEYFQGKGEDPITVAEQLTGSREAFAEATATGGDLAVPLSRYAAVIAPTEHNAYFSQEARFAPEEMNAREAAEFAKTQGNQETVKEASTALQSPIRDSLLQQLDAAGVERTAAESYATLYEQAFTALGQRAGVDPVELFNRYGLEIAREGIERPANSKPTVDTGIAEAQTQERNGTDPQAGELVSDGSREQPQAVSLGSDEGASDSGSAPSSRLPGPLDYPVEVFRRATRDVDTQRLTPDIRRELLRMADELREFPFENATWNVVDAAGPNDGNAGGGKYHRTPGGAGAPVYDDVLDFSPPNKSTKKGRDFGNVDASRGKIEADIRQALETGRIHSNVAEGAVRVAERRAANDLRHISGPLLPAPWDDIAVSDAFDAALEADAVTDEGELDDSFDVTEYEQGPANLFDEPADDLFAAAEARIARREQLADTLAATGQPVKLQDARGRTVLVGPDMSKPGRFRWTRFEDGEPTGHTEAATMRQALVDAMREGYEPPVDVLDTGEQQPRLPGAEDVREQNIATPEFEAPFALTAPVSKAKKGRQETLFQPAKDVRDLVIQHNLTAENLLHAVKMGGIPVPSLAIAKHDDTLTGFGEITLLGDARMADPQGYARPQVFGADVYAPRYPTVHFKIPAAGEKVLSRIVKANPEGGQHYYDLDTVQKEGAREIRHMGAVMAAFLKEQGIDIPPVVVDEPRMTKGGVEIAGGVNASATRYQLEEIIRKRGLEAEFEKYADGVFASLGATEHIFKGFTNQGNRSYKPHTLENVVAELKKELRGGESSSNLYGVGQLRSKFTPKFRSLDQIRKAKDRIVSDAAFEEVKKEVETELFAISDDLKPHYKYSDANRFGFVDTVIAVMEDAPKRGVTGALKEYGFEDVPHETQVDIAKYLQKLKTLPTEYFEAKILREVDLSEFAAAVVPEGVNPEAIKALERRGVQIFTYPKGDDATRKQAVADAAAQLGEKVLFQENGGKRGSIQFGQRNIRINLLAQADLSTFLHETGHFWLEVMGDVVDGFDADPATLTDTQRQMLADYGTLLQSFGVENRDGIGTEQHEQFARSFEAYLMEGKAPSVALRAPFARFRAWLLTIYRSLRGLNVELTPEVRGVFDRLVATDDAIATAQYEQGIRPMLTDAASAGMTPEQFDEYRGLIQQATDGAQDDLARRILREVTREQSAQWKDARQKTQTEVEAEVYQRREYIALAAMQRGTTPNGTPLDSGPLKLSKQALVAQFGPDITKQLPRGVSSRTDGLTPDAAADLLGFSSGDELVRAVQAVGSMREAIQTETDRRMTEQFGDMRLDGSLADAAEKAVTTIGRPEIIRAELTALNKGMRAAVIPPARVLKQMAEERLAGLRVREIRPGTYLQAARRASEKAFALKDTDRVAAVQAKQQELVSHALYRAALDAQDDIDSRVAFARSLETPAARARLGKAGQSYLEQVDDLLDRYEFRPATLKALDKRTSLQSWVAAQQAEGLPVDIPQAVLDDARRINYRNLTLEELVGVTDTLKQIAHLARVKNRLLASKDQRDFEDVRDGLVASVTEHANRPAVHPLEPRLPSEKAARNASKWFAAHRKLSSFVRQMDGWQDGGQMWDHIQRPLNDAANAEAAEKSRVTAELAEIHQAAFAGEERTIYRKTFIPAINDSLTRQGRLAVALNWGNEGNRQRLMSYTGWTPDQVQAVLDTLTAKDVAFVNAIWKTVNSYWPQIAAKAERVNGVAPEKVEGVPFHAAGGAFDGGYYPIAYEGWLSPHAQGQGEAEFADNLKRASYVHATTKHGHEIARVAEVKRPLRLDLGVIGEHLSQVIHDLTHHETLIDASRLLADKKVADAIVSRHGAVLYENLKGVLRDVAWGNAPTPDWYRPLGALRRGVVVASLGWNLTTTALQPFQSVLASRRVGAANIAKAYVRWAKDAAHMENTAAWIRDRSPFMATRGLTQLREINEIRNRVGLDTGVVSGWMRDALEKIGVHPSHKPFIADSYFYLIQKGQQLADIPVWIAAYEQAMADSTNTEDRAVALADQAVRDTQGSGQIHDLSQVERHEVLKLLTTFYSYNNLLYGQVYESIAKTGSFKDPKQLGRLAIDATVLLFLGSAITFFIRRALMGGDDDDDTSLAAELGKQELSDLFALMVGTREMSAAIEGRPYEGPAGTRFFAAGVKVGKQAAQGDIDPAFWKSLNQAGGIVFHYPATQVQRTAAGIAELMDGGTDNPSVILTGPRKGSK